MLTRDQMTANITAMEKQGASQQDVQSYLDGLRGPENAAPPAPVAPPAPPSPQESMLQKHLWGPLSDIVTKGAGKLETSVDQYAAGKQGLGETALQFVGTAAGALGEAGMSALKSTMRPQDKAAAKSLMGFISGIDSPLMPIKSAIQGGTQLAKEHPRAAADIGAVADIAGVVPLDLAGEGIAKAGSEMVKAGAEALPKVGEAATQAVAAMDEAGKAARAAKFSAEADALAGAIGQGDKKLIPVTRRVLRTVDTAGTTSYQDMSGILKDRVGSLVTAQDKAFDAEGSAQHYLIEDFNKDFGHGITDNPVHRALSDLEELYTTTHDNEGLAKLRELTAKADAEGLSAKEVNQIARDYNTELGQKGFSPKTGAPLTSVQAGSFENTRKAVKEAARSVMKSDVTRELDSQITDALRVKQSIDKFVEKVNMQAQRAIRLTRGQKVANAVASGVNILTGGTLKPLFKGFLKLAGEGRTTLDYAEIEKALNANLRKLSKIEKMPDLEMVKSLNKK